MNYLNKLNNINSYVVAFIAGVFLTLAFAPFFIFPLAIIGFSLSIYLIDQAKAAKKSFFIGWWFGFGHFTTGLYWFVNALLTDPGQFGWMIPFAIMGIPAILSVYIGLVFFTIYKLPFRGVSRVIIYAVVWTIVEMLRGFLFTGFPWNLVGYIWGFSINMCQIVSIVGVWGLSFITVICFSAPAVYKQKSGKKLLICSCLLIMSTWLFGAYRISHTNVDKVAGVRLRLIQPNIPVAPEKWNSDSQLSILQKLMRMSSDNGYTKITHLIWPEAAVPYYIFNDASVLKVLKYIVPKNGALITGSIRVDGNEFQYNFWNSIHVIDDQGKIISFYDKSHLVPFGEYVPLRWIFDKIIVIKKITAGFQDFKTGKGPTTIAAPGLSDFAPLICYEAIFPDNVMNKAKKPGLFINVTNDAWYGKSTGPYQHFYMVRMRAIEYGVSLVRSANSGISAVIDPLGKIIARTNLQEQTILDSDLPNKLSTSTIYSVYGCYLILLILSIFTILAIYLHKILKN